MLLIDRVFSLVYVLPPLINRYGKMFSVAELIASGFASFDRSGIRPSEVVDITPVDESTSG